MAEYNVQTPDGANYHISADSDEQANSAISDIMSNHPAATQNNKMDLTAINRDAIEPNVMGETEPPEQKVLSSLNTVASGAAIPGLAQGIYNLPKLAGKAMNAIPATKNIVGAIGDMSNDMLLKSLGTMGGQIRKSGGLEAARDAASVGKEAGLNDVFSTARGRKAALEDLLAKHGQEIGNLRAEAGPASPNLLKGVQEQVAPKYNSPNPDVYSAEAPNVQKGINTIANTAGSTPTNAGIAKGITNLNKYATAEGAKQATNAYTDVANAASRANDAEIAQSLGSDKAAQYVDALKKESGGFHLRPYLERGEIKEAVGRGGQGIVGSMIQKVADSGGYRAASKGLSFIHDALSNNPQSFGKFAAPLQAAKMSGGPQAVSAMHYILSTTYPEYNQLTQDQNQ